MIRVDQSGGSIHLVVADAEEGLGVDGEDHVAHLQPGLKQEPCITLCRHLGTLRTFAHLVAQFYTLLPGTELLSKIHSL